jgi:hypothetical protein
VWEIALNILKGKRVSLNPGIMLFSLILTIRGIKALALERIDKI